jgi:hypothetical protein
MQQLVTAAKNVLLTIVLAFVGWFYLRSGIPELATLPLQPSRSALSKVGDWIAGGMALMLVVVFMVAIIDVPLQNFLFKRRLKMSHQEVKQEHKESEGSPEVKGKIRQKQREMAHRASVSACPRPTSWSPTPPTTPWPCATTKPPWPPPGDRHGRRPGGTEDPRSGQGPRHSGARIAHAGPCALRQRRTRPGHPVHAVHRRGPGAGLCLPPQGLAARRPRPG